jgi:hypothetical protein
MVNGGAVRQLVMDEPQELLQHRTPLLPTGVPNGLDEVFCSIRYSRQTCQVQQRMGHEDQTLVFPNGFGTSHPIRVETELPLTVLIKRFRRPSLARQADDLGGAPVHSVRDQHYRAARQRLVLKTYHDAYLAQAGNTDRQREAPIGLLSHVDGRYALAGISGTNSSTAMRGPGSFIGQSLVSRR